MSTPALVTFHTIVRKGSGDTMVSGYTEMCAVRDGWESKGYLYTRDGEEQWVGTMHRDTYRDALKASEARLADVLLGGAE